MTEWLVGDRVTWRGHVGTVTAIANHGIHFRVTFDEPLPSIEHMVDGSAYFYGHELAAVAANCFACGNALSADRAGLGVCETCTSPAALAETVGRLPEPLRGVFERVGRDFGLIETPVSSEERA